MRASLAILACLVFACEPPRPRVTEATSAREAALVGTVLEGNPGPTGAPGFDTQALEGFIAQQSCASFGWIDQVVEGSYACNVVSGVTAVSGGNGVTSSGGLTPALALSGAYAGDLTFSKSSASLPDGTLTLVEADGGTNGTDYSRVRFQENTGGAWRWAVRVNSDAELGANQGWFRVLYDPPGAVGESLVAQFEGNGNMTGSKLQAKQIDVPDGQTSADAAASALSAVGMRVRNDATDGVALQVDGPLDANVRTDVDVAAATFYDDPATHWLNANVMRLPFYRVAAPASAGTTANAACLPGDVVIGGSCTTADGTTHATRQEPDVASGMWRCTFSGGSGHFARAMCLKSY